MAKRIEYFLSLNSPWSYLGGERLKRIAAQAGAEVEVLPVKLGEVFGKTGGVPLPQRSPARQAYRLVELQRWRDHLGIPILLQPKHFPADEILAAHAVITAGRTGGDALAFAIAVGKALWEQDRDIGDAKVLGEVASSVGIDLDRLRADPAFPGAAERHTANTDRALERQVFGAPAYVYNGELFWGQDRLDFLERALRA
jgi:2-hydroxychromene-2-carboxylate isomerase